MDYHFTAFIAELIDPEKWAACIRNDSEVRNVCIFAGDLLMNNLTSECCEEPCTGPFGTCLGAPASFACGRGNDERDRNQFISRESGCEFQIAPETVGISYGCVCDRNRKRVSIDVATSVSELCLEDCVADTYAGEWKAESSDTVSAPGK